MRSSYQKHKAAQLLASSSFTFTTIPLIIVSFFWISGGIYGNEEMMLIASPNIVLPALLMIPIFYSVPMVLVITELASALPVQGGYVAWISEGLGHQIGTHNKYWSWISYVIDSSLYPRFAAAYLSLSLGKDRRFSFFAAVAIIAGVTVVKLLGTGSFVRLSTVLSFFSLLPSMLFLLLGLRYLRVEAITQSEASGEPTQWNDLLTWLLWLYSGILNISSVAGEVSSPETTYLRAGIVLLFLDIVFVNFTPLWVSLSIDSDRANYQSGHFGELAEQLAGPWLSGMMTVGAQVSQIGIYNSVSTASDRYLASFLTVAFPSMSSSNSCLLDSSRSGAPAIVIIFNAWVAILLLFVPINDTLNMTMAMVSVSILLLLMSFLVMRYSRPGLARKWTIPGGAPVLFLVLTPCALFCLLNIVLGFLDRQGALFGVIPKKFVFLLCVFSFGGVVHLVVVLLGWDQSAKAVTSSEREDSALISNSEKSKNELTLAENYQGA